MITISAFRHVPDFARGIVRDVRVRWALEEAGLPYESRLIEQGGQDDPDYRALQPFGQVPIFEEDGFVLFETGAIVHYIGEGCPSLLPVEPSARARAIQWMYAALNSVEPFVVNMFLIDRIYAGQEWAALRRPSALELMHKKIDAVAKRLGGKRFLEGDAFTAGDLMMASVLRFHPDVRLRDPRLAAYIDRCTERPAFQRALSAQLADFSVAA